MGNPKERDESEKQLGRLENKVRDLLLAEAANEEVELAFIQLGADGEYLKLLTDKRSVQRPEGYFEITLVSGRRKRDKSFYIGGYLLAVKGESGETTCLVLGSAADHDNRKVKAFDAKEPVFVEVAPGEEYFTAKIGERDWFNHLAPLETIMWPGSAVGNKAYEVIGEILLGDREEIRRHLVGPAPEFPHEGGRIVVMGPDGKLVTIKTPPAPPLASYQPPIDRRPMVPKGFVASLRDHATTPPRANIIRVTPSIPPDELGKLKKDVAKLMRGGEAVDIAGLPENFPSDVETLLGAGAIEIKRLGIDLEQMQLGETYEGKNERIYRATQGGREDGQYIVQVSENLKTGKLNLMIGLIVEKGEGRGKHTVGVTLNYENNLPVVVDASTVELAVTCDGQTIRADFSEKKGSLNGYAGGRRESKAGNLLFGCFPDREYSFPKAFGIVRELTRKTYGWLGKE